MNILQVKKEKLIKTNRKTIYNQILLFNNNSTDGLFLHHILLVYKKLDELDGNVKILRKNHI